MQNYTYEEILDRIENARRFGNLPGVEVSRRMLETLGEPQKRMPYVHIAGTNGKGSTSAFLTSILRKAGKKVGTFTSPHLVDFRERITVNGIMIPKEDVVRIGNQLLNIDFGVSATMFDYCLIIAVIYFKEQQCDITIMETGLGGKLDSTNALGVPEVAIITKIGFDHVAILGNTLSEIAAEKAGIIKPGSYVVLETQDAEARDVLVHVAKDNGEYYELTKEDIAATSEMEMKLLGVHQWENAAAAIQAAKYLLIGEVSPERRNTTRRNSEIDYMTCVNMSEERCKEVISLGIKDARWPGRMEILSRQPFLMVDGAHNGHGVLALRDSLCNLYPGEKFHFIMGVMADKDYETMVTELLPLAKDFVTVTPESDRALQGEELARVIQKKGIHTKNCTSVQEALKKWIEPEDITDDVENNEKTVCFGSLYFIGEIEGLIH